LSHRTALFAAVGFVGLLCARPALADLVTPGSISPRPSGWVTDQYRGLGLVFYPVYPDSIANQYHSNVATFYDGGWSSYTTGESTATGSTPWTWLLTQPGVPAGTQTVGFVMPGTEAPATTSSLRIQVYSAEQNELTLAAFGLDANRVGFLDLVVDPGTTWLTLSTPGIRSFTISESWWFPPGSPPQRVFNSPYFSINAIEFHPVAAVPEPGGLTLFGLGCLALAGSIRARRKRGTAQSPGGIACPAPPAHNAAPMR
jgi:hypothetical protein